MPQFQSVTFSCPSFFLEVQLCGHRDSVVGGTGHAGGAEHDDEMEVGAASGGVADLEEGDVPPAGVPLLGGLATQAKGEKSSSVKVPCDRVVHLAWSIVNRSQDMHGDQR